MAARSFVLACCFLLLASAGNSGAAQRTWEPLGISGGGGMFCPAISPADGKRMMIHCDMSAAYLSKDGGRNWKMIHHSQLRSNTRCRPAFHPTDPDTVYSVRDWDGRTVCVSEDFGTTWKALGTLPETGMGELAIDPADPARMFAGSGESVCRSTDGGRSWTACAGPSGTTLSLCIIPQCKKGGGIFAATSSGLWHSSDGGESWLNLTPSLPGSPLLAFAAGANDRDGLFLYCSIPTKAEDTKLTGGIFISRDSGASWQPAGKGLNTDTAAFDRWAMGPVAQYEKLLTTCVAPKTVYAFNSNTGIPPPHHATCYRSDDAGENWVSTFQADPRFSKPNVETDYTVAVVGQYYQSVPFGVAIDARDPMHILTVSGDCYITENGGKSWFPGHTRPLGKERPNQDTNWVCNGLTVTTCWHWYPDPFERKRSYLCYTDIGFAISEDGTESWKWWQLNGRSPWGNTCYELALDPKKQGRAWGAFSNVHDIPFGNIIWNRHKGTGTGGVCFTDNSCRTWKPCKGLPEVPATSIVLDPASPIESRTLYVGMFSKGVYRSKDGGTTWEDISKGLGAPENMRVCSVQLHPDGTIFALITALVEGRTFNQKGVGLYRMKPKSEVWERIAGDKRFLWPKGFTVDPKDSAKVYLSTCDANGEKCGGLYLTTDGGGKWDLLSRQGPEHAGAFLHPKKDGWLYMTLGEGAPKAGLWLSKDNGVSIKPMMGLPFANATRVHFNPYEPGAIYVTTFGGSLWRGPEDEQ